MTRAAFFCLGISLLGCSRGGPLPKQAADEGTTAFVDVNVVPLDSERVMPGQTVLVRAGTIVAVGPSSKVAVPPGARVLDGHDKYLMPGLADMHAHVVREEDLLIYVARGVTTVRNMWGAPVHLEWRARIARGELVGPTIHTAGPIVDGENPGHDGSLVVRNAAEAEQAIALHRRAGYDFVKIYTNLPLAAFEGVMTAAKSAGLRVVGHVPRPVGFERALDAGQWSIEHLTAFSEALQTSDSPVAGKFDAASRQKKLDHIDDAKVPTLVKHIRDSGAWICPTRAVMNQHESPEALKLRLARPEMKYVAGFDRAIWESEIDRSPERISADARYNAFGDRMIAALHAGHARLLVGTDTGNPFVVPGYSVHEELEWLVRAGLTPYEALSAATRSAAEFLGKDEFGTIAVGKRADLLLVDGNPLVDVRAADRIEGVMVHGRWFGSTEQAALLASVEDFAKGRKDPFARVPPLVFEGTPEFSATFRITWRGAAFGAERIVVAKNAAGERVIHAQSFDPHEGQTITMHLFPGEGGHGRRLLLESDGAIGRGRAELLRESTSVHVRGVLLPGTDASLEAPLEAATTVTASSFLASKLVLVPALQKLEVGQSLEASEAELSLGSKLDLPVNRWTIT
ncbi:MAG: amidohydrolase family protein, partial [Polyangiales bacterium]